MDLFKKAHYNLNELKKLIKNPKYRVITVKARKNAFDLGFLTDEEIVDQVLNLSGSDIYKTMTANFDNTLWQDVYKPVINGVEVYIKLQKSHDGNGVVIQFKLSDEN